MTQQRIILILLLITASLAQARCCRRGSRAAGFFSALTGTAMAAQAYSDDCYYREGPPYVFAYPGAPLYTYDYPTYVYAPVYSYRRVRTAIYPSYHYRRW